MIARLLVPVFFVCVFSEAWAVGGSTEESTAIGPPVHLLNTIGPKQPVVKAEKEEEETAPNHYLIPDYRSFWTLRLGGFFPRGVLHDRIGNGWTFGASTRVALSSFLEPELSVDWIYASSVKAGQDNSLHLVPITLGLRFSRSWRNLSAYLAPEIGGIFWNSGATRLLDKEDVGGQGFDFLGAASLGFLYEWKENSIFSLRYRASYAAGYINQIYSTFAFEWSKRF